MDRTKDIELLIDEVSKWKLPGWRPEKIYRPSVMVNNWYEDRLKFQMNVDIPRLSTHQVDFRRYCSYVKPDAVAKCQARLRDEGMGRRLLIDHHAGFGDDLITWYDENYNNKERPQGEQPTNFGLLQRKQAEWAEAVQPHASTYRNAFNTDPRVLGEARVHRRAGFTSEHLMM